MSSIAALSSLWSADSIKIMTMHASKGLEFPVVALAGVVGHMPEAGQSEVDEARLFYVAATRATETLWPAARSGYVGRALVQTPIGRYKALIGARLRARRDAGQRFEATVGAVVLNRMIEVGRPSPVRYSRDVN